ncbi:MAG: M20/M25/M40 family metallo-hydrolase, partial [Candidatus Aminicenantes bacterium]|nr:M20/M25/M40 family metallo-hydrolase [Candidatus Aminicenantes bacterium]
PVEFTDIPGGYKAFKISAGGMKGGHSGIDIAVGKANAIQVLGRTLRQIIKENIDIRIADLKGGSAHNAIPRDAWTYVCVPGNEIEKVKKIVSQSCDTLRNEYKIKDPDISITLKDAAEGEITKALTAAATQKTVDFIMVIPHGVAAMSQEIKDLVETSNNLANISLENNAIRVLTSQRSSVISRLKAHTDRIEAAARVAGGEARSGDGYPPWQPNMDSPLLARSIALYEKLNNKKPVVEVIHAGLECGIIGAKYPGMDMISIGPTLKNPHSPEERINLKTVGKIWDFIVALLKDLK